MRRGGVLQKPEETGKIIYRTTRHLMGDQAIRGPSNITNEQLSLLLGIAHEAGVQLAAFVDAAVAAAATSIARRVGGVRATASSPW